MIFISDVHHGLDSLENLPSGKGPLVILGDLINWIDYRNGDGIAKDVFGEESVTKLVELRKKHDFTRRKELWNELFSKDREAKQKKIEESIYRQYIEVFEKINNGSGIFRSLIKDEDIKKDDKGFIANLRKNGILFYKDNTNLEDPVEKPKRRAIFGPR